MGNTSIYLPRSVKDQLGGVRDRNGLGSYNKTIIHLIGIEKELELSKLSLPTKDDIRKIISEEIRKASGR